MTSLVEAYFGLKQPPFSISESSGPVFMTEPLRTAAIFVRSGLAEGASLLAVTGPAGIGKSSLVRSLPKLIGGGDRRIAVMSGRARQWEDLRRVLMREFGIGRDRITRDGLVEARAKYGKLLIVVDDAQHLSPDLLERICILPQLRTADDEPAAQVLLLADLDAVAREDTRPLLAWLDVEARHLMQSLPRADTHRYIDTRMRRAGWLGEPLVCESGAGALYRVSLGNPRRLSTACMDILEYAAVRGVAQIDAEFVVECLSADEREAAEPLSAPSGAALCCEMSGEMSAEVRDESGPELADDDWGHSLENSPLTAENIIAAPSLELAHVDQGASGSRPVAPPMESIRAVARPLSQSKPAGLRSRSQTNGRRSLVLGVCALVAAAAVYTARSEVAGLLREVGTNLLFVAEVVEGGEIDAVELPVAAQPPLMADIALY